jgi:PAT family beta-lactamase induction signal transducer AmpG
VTAPGRPGFWDVVRALGRPKVAAMAALGFSCGLPFMMFGNTLGYWLGESHIALTVIGFTGWIGFTYSFKFVFGAAVDRLPLPFLKTLGRRRSWMLLTQAGVAAGLAGMAAAGPGRLPVLLGFALFTGVCAATQDTAVDAWRIESSADREELGLLTAAHSLGYKVALIATESWILLLPANWPTLYAGFGALMAIGAAAALFVREPDQADAVMAAKAAEGRVHPVSAVRDAIVGPIVAFFRMHGWQSAALMLAMIASYHLCDYARGQMGNTYYIALGLSKPVVGWVRTSWGLAGGFVGVALGGLVCARIGPRRALVIGAIVQPLAVAAFALLGAHGGDFDLVRAGPVAVSAFDAIMGADTLAMSFSGVALVAYMSTLTSLGYTATQYALMTSAMTWVGKTLKGFSGQIVTALQPGRTLLEAYSQFYLLAAAIGLPAIVLCLVLAARDPPRQGREDREAVRVGV